MGVSCQICNRVINKKYPGIKCGKCMKFFHSLCANINEELFLALQSDYITWFCTQCRTDHGASSLDSADISLESNDLKAITKSDLRATINSLKFELMHEITSKINLLVESVNFCSNKITDFEIKLKETNDKLMQFENIKSENERLKIEVHELNTKVHDLEQYSKLNNVIISNYPDSRNENIFDILSQMGSKIGLEITQKGVDAAHRLSSVSSSNNKPKNIVVKFISRNVKEQFITAFKQNKAEYPNIYVNEHLTQKNSFLYKLAREKLSKGCKYVWTKNCKIFLRKDDNSRIRLIRNEEDLRNI